MKVKDMVDLFEGNVVIKFYRNNEMIFCGGKEECDSMLSDDYSIIEEKEVVSYGVEADEYDDTIPNLRIVVAE